MGFVSTPRRLASFLLLIPALAGLIRAAQAQPDSPEPAQIQYRKYFEAGRYALAESVAVVRLETARRRLPPGHRDLASPLSDLGHCRLALAEPARAEPLFEEALSIRRTTLPSGDPDLLRSMDDLAHALRYLNRTQKSADLCREALDLARPTFGPDHPLVLVTLADLGRAVYLLGEREDGVSMLREAVAGLKKSGDGAGRDLPLTQISLASMLRAGGYYPEAEANLAEALTQLEHLFGPDHPDMASALLELALVLEPSGEYDRAIELARRALDIRRDRFGERHPVTVRTCGAVGSIMTGSDESGSNPQRSSKAEAYLREIEPLYRETFGAQSPEYAGLIHELGWCLVIQWKQLDEAETLLRQALEIRRIHGGATLTLHCMSRLAYATGDFAQAESLLLELLNRIACEQGRTCREYLSVLEGLGIMRGAQEDFQGAADYLGQAAELWEMLRLRAGGEHVRASFWSSPHERLAGALLAQDRREEAWAAIDRLQGLTLAEMLLVLGKRRLTPEEQAREASLNTQLTELENLLSRIQTAAELDSTLRGRVTETSGRLVAAEASWNAFQGSLASKYPGSEGRFPLKRIQAGLDHTTAIVSWLDPEFGFDHPRAWGFVIRDHGPVHWVPLPITLSPDSSAGYWARELGRWMVAPASSGVRREPDPTPPAQALEIWRLRVAPLMEHLQGVTDLVVIPSRAMNGVPMEAIPTPEGSLMATRFRIRYAPSATIFAWLREQRGGPRPARRGLLVGDPPFRESHLADMESDTVSEEPTSGELVFRGVVDRERGSLENLPRLRWARREIESAAGWLPGSDVLVGPAASEERVQELARNDRLRNYSVLHFATHAVVSSSSIDESALVLSQVALVAATQETPTYDGLATAAEIVRGWHLDADLVVLSGCESALGKPLAEGVFGLTQAFLVAGARATLVSLWPVDDEAAALLIGRFYELWLGQGSARTKTQALQEARLWLRDLEDDTGRRRYAHPYYWAGFILIGDGI